MVIGPLENIHPSNATFYGFAAPRSTALCDVVSEGGSLRVIIEDFFWVCKAY
jgi:hypothetical protein